MWVQPMAWEFLRAVGVAKKKKKKFIDLNVKAKTIKTLEENIEVKLYDLGLNNIFLDMTAKT